jgi:hypothetical protein
MVPWAQLPSEFKESNRDQAAHTRAKLAYAGYGLADLTSWDAPTFTFTDAEVEELARMEHDRWSAHERRTASRLPGRRRRPADLVPWEELPAEEREVDRAFVRSLPPLLAQLGYQVVPSGRSWSTPGT